MKLYESVFIARPELSPTQVESAAEKFAAIVKEKGGDVSKIEYSGLRQLAYPIKKSSKGHYVLMNVSATAEALKELDRQFRLNEDVIRFLNVKVEAHETGKSMLTQPQHSPRESSFRGRDRNSDTRGRDKKPEETKE